VGGCAESGREAVDAVDGVDDNDAVLKSTIAPDAPAVNVA
jgi:hypothetical protein